MNYLILANLYMAIFYTFYVLLLKKETFFQYNRIYLTGTLLLSYLLPLIQLPWVQQQFSQSPMQQVRASFDEVVVVTTSRPVAVDSGEAASPIEVIYWTGVALMLLWLCFRIYFLARQLSKPQSRQSFSFLHFVRLDHSQAGARVIWQHELAHVRYLHSLDVIFSELTLLFSWFNPIAYLYRKSIKLQHEYQADAYVAASGQDAASYAEILLSNALRVPLHTLTNHFNQQSFIKNRIIMLFKEKSKRTALLKYVFAAPLFAGMIIFSSAKGPDINLAESLSKQVTSDSDESPKSGEPGRHDMAKFSRGMGENIHYSKTAIEAGKAGNIGLGFTKNNNDVKDIQTVGNFGYGMEEEVVRVVKMPKVYENLSDGKYYMNIRLGVGASVEGQAVNPYPKTDIVPDQFKDYEKLESVTIVGFRDEKPTTRDTSKEKGDIIVDVTAEPRGGFAYYYQTIANHIQYSQEAIDHGVKGTVILSVTINTEGAPENIKIIQDPGFGIAGEAIRIIKTLPKWEPGINNLNEKKENRVVNTASKLFIPVDASPVMVQDTAKGEKVDFTKVEVKPEPPGGMAAFLRFIGDNYRYPQAAVDKSVNGKVILQFVINADGSVSDIKLIHDLGFGTGEEAIRVLKLADKWKPGLQDGKPVRVEYTLPIALRTKVEKS